MSLRAVNVMRVALRVRVCHLITDIVTRVVSSKKANDAETLCSRAVFFGLSRPLPLSLSWTTKVDIRS